MSATPKKNTVSSHLLKNARKKRKMSQGELAKIVGTSVSALSSMENGRYAPSGDIAKRLSEELEIPINDLTDVSIIKEVSTHQEFSSKQDGESGIVHLVNIFEKLSSINKKELIQIAEIKLKNQQ
ncbi:helix-turn-helix transcriptional regulator [Enterococcus faecalis]|nr:helix-turn-helix transcriptional regulator [Enterococcus faecalis]